MQATGDAARDESKLLAKEFVVVDGVQVAVAFAVDALQAPIIKCESGRLFFLRLLPSSAMRLCGIAPPAKEARSLVLNALKSNGTMSTKDLFYYVQAQKASSSNRSKRQELSRTKKLLADVPEVTSIPSISCVSYKLSQMLAIILMSSAVFLNTQSCHFFRPEDRYKRSWLRAS